MADPAAEARIYRFYADMLDAYGERWPEQILHNSTFDTDSPEIELPPAVHGPEDILIAVTVRFPHDAYRNLKNRADAAATTTDDMIIDWARSPDAK
ncbi:hypothetical protein [Nocardia wallacei]|uniref:hypothetical protein n=1 Tax=Nocardia wallacei TaxID=480035 RepID=UPI0024588C95|nr:hypothetical protein [Nocardia wallacei]